ncbi:VOC family protein [Ornithinibacillus salinisoli]|uniref:VOC family protein n=1 Tax=Ornithinibacillus salinisoli TaxID=1848459 RepID=A0ABW4W171_9BACI
MEERIQSLTVFLVSNLEKSKEFYQKILECDVTDWWALRKDGIKLGIKLLQANETDSINPNSSQNKVVSDVYAYADDYTSLETLYDQVKERGANIVQEPEETNLDWGSWKEFSIQDPDGYVISFGTARKN